jgi:hypothetical protein
MSLFFSPPIGGDFFKILMSLRGVFAEVISKIMGLPRPEYPTSLRLRGTGGARNDREMRKEVMNMNNNNNNNNNN